MRARHAVQGRFIQHPALTAAEVRSLALLPVAVLVRLGVRLGLLAPTARDRRARALGFWCDGFILCARIEAQMGRLTDWMDKPGPSEDTPAMQPEVDR